MLYVENVITLQLIDRSAFVLSSPSPFYLVC